MFNNLKKNLINNFTIFKISINSKKNIKIKTNK